MKNAHVNTVFKAIDVATVEYSCVSYFWKVKSNVSEVSETVDE